ncbi:Imidazole glycerol phosphate synthase subunit HisH [Serratia quinivorans]|uniref:Imidazole glycerol phosphate synthase subunit HisH n=1 Tax=Serratia quinivorans TaxID=137545 RepID=A0A379YJE2_9GAMM|nr:Imidazole glycerol phosphate synthase subunit HisH [Serratia quinivorans]
MDVVILDTGCANLASVTYAVQRLGYRPEVSRDPEIVLRADKLFLPGVGTAQAAMDQLEQRELIELIKACTQPVLGICLGMQLLAKKQRRKRRHRHAGHYRYSGNPDDRLRPAAAAHGLESGVCAGGSSPVPRH